MQVSSSSVVILGIDPGLAHTGWGVVEKRGDRYRALAYGCVATTPDASIGQRLKVIHDEMLLVIDKFHPTELGIESVFFGVNTRSAFATGQARGAALVACASRDLDIGEYSPAQIKQVVTGTGTADKGQVTYMVRALLHLDHDPRPDHAADALAAAICQGTFSGIEAIEQAAGSGRLAHVSAGPSRSWRVEGASAAVTQPQESSCARPAGAGERA